MKPTISGLHHVTAIAGPAQRNVDFYAGFLGLRLVKKTVNFDDPGTYHLYYGDDAGRPGTILTFFPWADVVPGRAGAGMTEETAFSVPQETLDDWMSRFAEAGYDFDAPTERFGEQVLTFKDPDGLGLALVAHAEAGSRPASYAVRSFHSVTLQLASPARTARLLTDVFGYEAKGEDNWRLRFQAPGEAHAGILDLIPARERGRAGAGTVHHIAFRAHDEAEQLEWRERVQAFGLQVTEVKDRNYFKSIYFREPGGVLFEIATDPPGFTADETMEELGSHLKLPAWLEPRRAWLEAQLPVLNMPAQTGTRP